MNIIDSLRSNILYFFSSLPYVIVLYEFFMAIPFTNMAYIVLLAGQVIVVPLLYYIFRAINMLLINYTPKVLQLIILFVIMLLTIIFILIEQKKI